MIKKTPHFLETELACKGIDCCNYDCEMDFNFMNKIEGLRSKTGPLKVNSGYRCKAHNKAVGGVSNSFHVRGKALDLVPVNISLDALYSFAKINFNEVIRYPTFIHVAN